MLAAVHGRLAPIMAHVQFAEARLLEEDVSMYIGSLRHELAVKGWLNGLVKKSALGSLLTILCSLYSGHNDRLSSLLAYVPPALRLPEAVAQGDGPSASSSDGAGGQAAAGGSLAAAHVHLEAAHGLATDAFEAHNSARASRLSSLLLGAHETPDPAAGRVAGLEVKQVLRSALELFTTAAAKMPPPQSKAIAAGGINSMARRMLMIKVSGALVQGGWRRFHLCIVPASHLILPCPCVGFFADCSCAGRGHPFPRGGRDGRPTGGAVRLGHGPVRQGVRGRMPGRDQRGARHTPETRAEARMIAAVASARKYL